MLIGVLLLTPAGAHVGGTVGHLWKKHIRPKAVKTFYTKQQSNKRFVNTGEKASDADRIDGLDSTAFLKSYGHTIVVGGEGTPEQNGTALLNAMDGIVGNDSANRFLIRLEPGTYDLGSDKLIIKPWVDIEGAGELVTTIRREGFADTTASDAAVLGNNGELRFLSIVSPGAGSDHATGLRTGTNTQLTHVRFQVNGAAISNTAIRVIADFPVFRDIWVIVSAPSGAEAVGIASSRNPYLAGSLVQAGGDGSSTAIKVTDHSFNIENSVLVGGTNSVNADPLGAVQIGASRVVGAVTTGGTATVKCASSYNGIFDELDAACA